MVSISATMTGDDVASTGCTENWPDPPAAAEAIDAFEANEADIMEVECLANPAIGVPNRR